MSPAGFSGTSAIAWCIDTVGNFNSDNVSGAVNNTRSIRPVLNLSVNIQVTGSGTSSDPYVIQS